MAFHGCPLRCKYCLNPQGLSDDAKVMMKTPEEVMQAIRKDELYYLATNGGVTFGGGEPLLRADIYTNTHSKGFILNILLSISI